jgi:hypothetical protein
VKKRLGSLDLNKETLMKLNSDGRGNVHGGLSTYCTGSYACTNGDFPTLTCYSEGLGCTINNGG